VAEYQENTVIVLNAAHAILAYMQQQGWNDELAKSAKQYLDTAKGRDSDNQKYLMLSDLYKDVALNYGLKT
jgi:hypothetical protein